jgi:hypothetical protein
VLIPPQAIQRRKRKCGYMPNLASVSPSARRESSPSKTLGKKIMREFTKATT